MRALYRYFDIPVCEEQSFVLAGFWGVFFFFFVLVASQVRLFLQKAKDLYKALLKSNSELHGDQYTLEDWAQDAQSELVLFFFSLTVAITKAAFNLGAKNKTPLWPLCVFQLFYISLKVVTAASVPQAQKSGLGCLKFGIQNKSVLNVAHSMFDFTCL